MVAHEVVFVSSPLIVQVLVEHQKPNKCTTDLANDLEILRNIQ